MIVSGLNHTIGSLPSKSCTPIYSGLGLNAIQSSITPILLSYTMIEQCFGANNTPKDSQQYKQWIQKWLPDGQNVYYFGFAAVCWAIWKCRNNAIFDAKLIRHPTEILLHSCAFMNFWARLYTSDFQGRLLDGVKTLLACAHKVLAQQAGGGHPWGCCCRRLQIKKIRRVDAAK